LQRSSLGTTVAIAVAAYALCDLVHEVLGHGLAALLVPGVDAVSLSSVALQTTGESRLVAAAGTLANLAAGVAVLGIFRRSRQFSPGAFFLWLFGSLNLLNATGYLLFSAILGLGDWEVVVRGLEPVWAWRAAMGAVGAAAYAGATVCSAGALARSTVARSEVPRLVFPAYVAGGILLVVASTLNPISPALILTSGASSGFAAMAGLTLVPLLVEKRAASGEGDDVLARSTAWIVAGIAIGLAFVGVVGPGIRL